MEKRRNFQTDGKTGRRGNFLKIIINSSFNFTFSLRNSCAMIYGCWHMTGQICGRFVLAVSVSLFLLLVNDFLEAL